MCDVTVENFEELFPSIIKNIQDASFIAFDGEFTGLSTNSLYEPMLADTPVERYRKLKKSLSQFTLCQCGLSAFVPDPAHENKYLAHTYNFYIFPRSFGPVNTRFLCQSSALEFLINHNFDFNKFIKLGVPYMNQEQEDILRKYHAKDTLDQNIDSFLMRQLDENYITPAVEMLEAFLKTSLNDVLTLYTIPKGIAQYMFVKTIEKRYNNLSCKICSNGTIIVNKVLKLDEPVDFTVAYENIFTCAVGFSRILKALVDQRKLLVGHNCLSDMILLYGKFFRTLPDNYEKFKNNVHQLFPNIYDTKHIAATLRKDFRDVNYFDVTTLETLYCVFSSPPGLFLKLDTPIIAHADGFTKYDNNQVLHEAGYDAYLTGYVFLRLVHLAAMKDMSSVESRPLLFEEHLNAAKNFRNCVNMSRAAVRYVRFGGVDPAVVLPERFIITLKGSSKSISAAQIAQDFLPFGSVDVILLSWSRALVAVSHRRRARDVVKAFQRNKHYQVTKYNWWYHSPEAQSIWISPFSLKSISDIKDKQLENYMQRKSVPANLSPATTALSITSCRMAMFMLMRNTECGQIFFLLRLPDYYQDSNKAKKVN